MGNSTGCCVFVLERKEGENSKSQESYFYTSWGRVGDEVVVLS